jgi:hypothetical protein
MTEATEDLGPQTPEPAKGLDAILSTALDGYGDEAPAAEPQETAEQKSDRLRDERGRFASTKDSAEAAPSEPEPAKAEAPAEPVKAAEPPAEEPIQPHARWDEALKAQFVTWPKDVQKAFLDRHNSFEGDYTRKTQELAETRKHIEPLLGEVQRAQPFFQHIGMAPQEFLRQSLNVAMNLAGDPPSRAKGVAQLVRDRQVPLPELLAELGIPISPDGQGAVAPDPAITQLHQTVSGLQRELQQQKEQREQAERQRAQAEFDALGQATDQSGQLKFPHFSRVNSTMIQLVASGQADTWDAAYTKAVRLDDDLYKQTVEAERQRVAAEAERARLEAVAKAKKAAPVSKSDGSPKGGSELKGLDAHLSAAIERSGIGG